MHKKFDDVPELNDVLDVSSITLADFPRTVADCGREGGRSPEGERDTFILYQSRKIGAKDKHGLINVPNPEWAEIFTNETTSSSISLKDL